MSNRLHHLCLSLLVLLSANACVSPDESAPASAQANMQVLEGKVYYLEKKLLPPDAVLEVTLENVSKQDVASTQMASVTQTVKGAPPYTFSLEYDAARIKPNMRYGLRAEVILSDKLLMTSTEHFDPFRNNQETINIKLSTIARFPAQ